MQSKLVRHFFYVLLSFLPLSGCISLKPYYAKNQSKWEEVSPPDSLKLKYSVFLIGDAGKPNENRQEPVLKLLQKQLYDSTRTKLSAVDTNYSRPEDIIIFLGDNIYETGLPEPDASDRKEKERRIIEQMKVVKNFRGKKIFIPGNHDWNEMRPGGLAAVNREEAFVEAYLNDGDTFIPTNGCPGPVELQVNKDLVMILIDSEWWLHKYEKPIAPDNGCTAGSRLEVIEQIKDIIVRNKGKNILLAQHHPLFTNGTHGGFFTLKDYIFPLTLIRDRAYIPLPIIGSIYPLMRKYGVSPQDLSNKEYQQLKRGLLAILADEPNVVMATGHEHALQLNKYENLNHIVSGAGSKSSALVKGNGASFAHGHKGFARLNYYDNGQCWVEFWEPEGDGSTGKLIFRTPLYAIPPKNRAEIAEEKQINYKDSVKVISAGKEYRASKYMRRVYGEHYRDTWAVPVSAPYLDLSTYGGGLTPIKMGGGKQTTSLQLQGKDGKLYQFRSISKDPSSLLPEGLVKTFAEDFLQDQISSANPYGGLVIPPMAKKIGIYYVNPQLVYMPASRLLGPYIQQVGGKLGTIEIRPDEDVSGEKAFGNADKAVSTRKMYEEIREDNDNEVDQKMFLRARLFDMLINDWDRHEDQWRWAEFKKDKGSLFRPIPRDHDQAFSKYDGFIPSLVSSVAPGLENFTDRIKNVKKINTAARNLDRNFLNELTLQQWLEIANDIKIKLTDATIDSAVRSMPPEAFKISGAEISAKLKSRRSQLVQVAEDYYKELAKEVRVAGSDKKEFIEIIGRGDSTRIRISKINSAEKIERTIFDRSFSRSETDEIQIFALNGRDSIIASGDKSKIKVRVVGGEGKDYISDKSEAALGNAIVYYDSDEGNKIEKGDNLRTQLSANPYVHYYDPNWFNYDIATPLPSLDFNADDAFFVGAGFSRIHYGFRKQPYSYKQSVKANYAPKTGAYTIGYRGDFYSLFKRNNDLLLRTSYNGPKYTFNYYGEGNSTPNIGDDIDFFRVRTKNLSLAAYYQKRFTEAFRVGIGPGYEHYWLEKQDNKFLTSADFPDKEDTDNPSRFATINTFANLNYVDKEIFPTRGIRWLNSARYFSEVRGTGHNFLQLKSNLAFYGTPNFSFPMTLAVQFGAATNIGDYKFFQANSLGSNTYLRGYRNNRFAGRSYLFNNTELRLTVSNVRNYFLTGTYGLFGFFDSGRVFSDNPERNTWHTGYGPGVWANFYNKFLVSVGYGMSKEGGYFSINGGFAF
ncbi:BamA/TamA family outer membrane protein [Desertivirga brevis]|uniref:BamA/TamA family outer membrane protein n=1 Tax=Desertivirga brevis TaxID=2810310 RepID=UPI001A97A203|nr:metallophosphoesterase [Pedobacter sp. SYSU D00873]